MEFWGLTSSTEGMLFFVTRLPKSRTGGTPLFLTHCSIEHLNQSANIAEPHPTIQRIALPDTIYPMGSFKLQFSVGFLTSCYVIMNISIA